MSLCQNTLVKLTSVKTGSAHLKTTYTQKSEKRLPNSSIRSSNNYNLFLKQ